MWRGNLAWRVLCSELILMLGIGWNEDEGCADMAENRVRALLNECCQWVGMAIDFRALHRRTRIDACGPHSNVHGELELVLGDDLVLLLRELVNVLQQKLVSHSLHFSTRSHKATYPVDRHVAAIQPVRPVLRQPHANVTADVDVVLQHCKGSRQSMCDPK